MSSPSASSSPADKGPATPGAVVHGYEVVDLAVVKDIVVNRLDDLLDFVKTVRDRLG